MYADYRAEEYVCRRRCCCVVVIVFALAVPHYVWALHNFVFKKPLLKQKILCWVYCYYCHCLINVKFASGIKNIIFGFYPYTPMCVSSVYSVLTRALWKNKSQGYYLGGIRTHECCNSRAVSSQLEHWDHLVARGSSNPMEGCKMQWQFTMFYRKVGDLNPPDSHCIYSVMQSSLGSADFLFLISVLPLKIEKKNYTKSLKLCKLLIFGEVTVACLIY